MKGKGTETTIFLPRMLIGRAIEMQRDLYLRYIYKEKVFDTVKLQRMLKMLIRLRIYEKSIIIIKNLYYQHRPAVKVEKEITELVNILVGLLVF